MQMRKRLESLVEEMLDGKILLEEAVAEFEKIYIQKAYARHREHISNTASALGIHRNTLSKRIADYHKEERAQKNYNHNSNHRPRAK